MPVHELSPHRRTPFLWHSFDLRAELPAGWREKILEVATTRAVDKTLVAGSVTSREASRTTRVHVSTVGGAVVTSALPWLVEFYHGRFRELAQELTSEPVVTALDPRYGVNLNIQRGSNTRYECHVDSNPIEGLLYVTSHPPGTGGELVVSNRGDVSDPDEVDRDATRIHPVAGHLVFFDARGHSHYVAPLRSSAAVRVVAAMNFYTPTCRESARPADLNAHLFGEPLADPTLKEAKHG